MAAWDAYIDNIITGSGNNADKAGIIGLDGGAPWTTGQHPNGIVLQGTEGTTIASCMKSRDFTNFQTNGVVFEGKKYRFLREEDDRKILMAKLKENGAITAQSTKTAIVLAHCKEGGQHGNVNIAVKAIAEYLEQQNM